MMIIAHVVWGAALGTLTRSLQSGPSNNSGSDNKLRRASNPCERDSAGVAD